MSAATLSHQKYIHVNVDFGTTCVHPYLVSKNRCTFEIAVVLNCWFCSSLQIKVVVFDKTGTLTYGRPEVVRVLLFVKEAICPTNLFTAIMGLAESRSEHPLGVAVAEFARNVSASNVHTMRIWTCVIILFLYTLLQYFLLAWLFFKLEQKI